MPMGRMETQWNRLPEVASLQVFKNRLKHVRHGLGWSPSRTLRPLKRSLSSTTFYASMLGCNCTALFQTLQTKYRRLF